MNIDSNFLIGKGAVLKKYKNGNIIFFENDEANYYYQVISGKVKMVNLNEDGKEYIQGLFAAGCSFGEPPMLIKKPYPCTAISIGESTVLKLRRDMFLNILKESPETCQQFLIILAKRIYGKSKSAGNIINHSPEDKILGFLRNEKAKLSLSKEKILFPFTRQEIANSTGLRVETVIRTIVKMKEANKLEIINRKIHF